MIQFCASSIASSWRVGQVQRAGLAASSGSAGRPRWTSASAPGRPSMNCVDHQGQRAGDRREAADQHQDGGQRPGQPQPGSSQPTTGASSADSSSAIASGIITMLIMPIRPQQRPGRPADDDQPPAPGRGDPQRRAAPPRRRGWRSSCGRCRAPAPPAGAGRARRRGPAASARRSAALHAYGLAAGLVGAAESAGPAATAQRAPPETARPRGPPR